MTDMEELEIIDELDGATFAPESREYFEKLLEFEMWVLDNIGEVEFTPIRDILAEEQES